MTKDACADAAVHAGAGAVGKPRHGDVRFRFHGVSERVTRARVRRVRDDGYPRRIHAGADFSTSRGSSAGILLDAVVGVWSGMGWDGIGWNGMEWESLLATALRCYVLEHFSASLLSYV